MNYDCTETQYILILLLFLILPTFVGTLLTLYYLPFPFIKHILSAYWKEGIGQGATILCGRMATNYIIKFKVSSF